MNMLDMLIIIIMCYCLVRGIFRGLVKELSSLIGVIAGFFAAHSYYLYLADFLDRWISDKSALNILSFMIIFCVIFIVVSLLGTLIKHILVKAKFGWTDKVGGSITGCLKGVLISAVLLIAFTTFLPKGADFVEKSFFAPHLSLISEQIIKAASKDMKYKFDANIEEFRYIWENRR